MTQGRQIDINLTKTGRNGAKTGITLLLMSGTRASSPGSLPAYKPGLNLPDAGVTPFGCRRCTYHGVQEVYLPQGAGRHIHRVQGGHIHRVQGEHVPREEEGYPPWYQAVYHPPWYQAVYHPVYTPLYAPGYTMCMLPAVY